MGGFPNFDCSFAFDFIEEFPIKLPVKLLLGLGRAPWVTAGVFKEAIVFDARLVFSFGWTKVGDYYSLISSTMLEKFSYFLVDLFVPYPSSFYWSNDLKIMLVGLNPMEYAFEWGIGDSPPLLRWLFPSGLNILLCCSLICSIS